MPAFSTHYIFAKELMERLKSTVDFTVCENAVYIGAQGPDIFFFHRALPWQRGKSLRGAGSALHRARPGDILDYFAKYLKGSKNPETAKSYAAGFIMHYALDRKCHPFVYYIQDLITDNNRALNPNSVHNTIELSLDSLLLSLKMGIEAPKAFETEKTFNCTQSEEAEIAEMLSFASAVIAPQSVTAQEVKTAIEDTKYAQRLLLDANGKKEKAMRTLESAAAPLTKNFKISSFLRTDDLENAKKYANINNGRWTSPFEDGKRRESFFELFEDAKDEAIDIINGFFGGASGGECTDNISFLTGVKVK